MTWASYDCSTGEIINTGFAPRGTPSSAFKHLGCVVTELPNEPIIGEDYVDIKTKKVLKKESYELSALPLPCNIEIEGVAYGSVNTQPAFEFDAPGTYTIEVDAGPKYLRKEFTIDYQP